MEPVAAARVIGDTRSPESFQCRFCEFEVDVYISVLCHEIDVHSPELSCTLCTRLVTKLSIHFRSAHAGDAVSKEFDESGGEGEEGTAHIHGNCAELVVKEERTEFDERDLDDWLYTEDGEPDPIDVGDRAPAQSSTPVYHEHTPEGTVASKKKRRPVKPTSPKRCKKLPSTSSHKTDTICDEVDAMLRELDRPYGGEFCTRGLIRDTAENVFCKEYRDVIGQGGNPCQDALAAAEMAKFVVEVEGSTRIVGPWSRTYRREDVSRDQLLCSQCALPFATKPALIMHLHRVHGDESGKVFRCKKCNKGYTQRSCLVRHCIWMRSGKTLKCKMRRCPEHFATSAERLKHLREVHGGIPCPHCDKKFIEWATLRTHMDVVHDENKSVLTCRICKSAKFTKTIDLKKHELKCRSGMNDRVRSVEEDSSTRSARQPRVDREKMRAYRKQYLLTKKQSEQKCTMCCVKCYSEEKRLQHEKECHYPDGNGGTSHKCAECAVVFLQVKALNAHMKTNHGYGQFKCPQCPKRYMCPSAVCSHIARDHRKVRFSCEQCGLEFVRKTMFDDHMAMHEGKPKYTCELCGKQFFHYPTWYDHKKRYCPMVEAKQPRGKKEK